MTIDNKNVRAPFDYHARLQEIANRDVENVTVKDIEYDASWKKRGGASAFFMLSRKWDRIEPQAKRHGYDIFAAIVWDEREEGIINDIRDLRRYLMLVEAEMMMRGAVLIDHKLTLKEQIAAGIGAAHDEKLKEKVNVALSPTYKDPVETKTFSMLPPGPLPAVPPDVMDGNTYGAYGDPPGWSWNKHILKWVRDGVAAPGADSAGHEQA